MNEDKEYLFDWSLLIKAELKPVNNSESPIIALFSRVYLEDSDYWIDSKMKTIRIEDNNRNKIKRQFDEDESDSNDNEDTIEDIELISQKISMGLPVNFGSMSSSPPKKVKKEINIDKYYNKYGKLLYNGCNELYNLNNDALLDETNFSKKLFTCIQHGTTLINLHQNVAYFQKLITDNKELLSEDDFKKIIVRDVMRHNCKYLKDTAKNYKKKLERLHFVSGLQQSSYDAKGILNDEFESVKMKIYPNNTEQKWIDYNINKDEFTDIDAPDNVCCQEIVRTYDGDPKNFDFSFNIERDSYLIAMDAMKYFGNNKGLKKYYVQRFRLFSKLNEGILLDEESWFSVTPEKIAVHIADRMVFKKDCLILDCFTGAGGNAIQFAKCGALVYAVDLDPLKIRIAKQNAKVYGVEDRIQFFCGNAFHIIDSFVNSRKNRDDLPFDAVFLSPPWGGPEYLRAKEFTLDMCTPNGYEIFERALKITDNIVYFLPRNTRVSDLVKLSGKTAVKKVDNEQSNLNCKIKTLTAYYGIYVPDC